MKEKGIYIASYVFTHFEWRLKRVKFFIYLARQHLRSILILNRLFAFFAEFWQMNEDSVLFSGSFARDVALGALPEISTFRWFTRLAVFSAASKRDWIVEFGIYRWRGLLHCFLSVTMNFDYSVFDISGYREFHSNFDGLRQKYEKLDFDVVLKDITLLQKFDGKCVLKMDFS